MARVTILKDNRLVRVDKEEFDKMYKPQPIKEVEKPVKEVKSKKKSEEKELE